MKNKDKILDQINSSPELQNAYDHGYTAQVAAGLITEMREFAGLSKKELAARLGVSAPRISEAEKGVGPQGPTFRFIRDIARACGFRWPESVADLQRLEEPAHDDEQVTFAQGDIIETSMESSPKGRVIMRGFRLLEPQTVEYVIEEIDEDTKNVLDTDSLPCVEVPTFGRFKIVKKGAVRGQSVNFGFGTSEHRTLDVEIMDSKELEQHLNDKSTLVFSAPRTPMATYRQAVAGKRRS